MSSKIRVIFMGTPEFAVGTLKALLHAPEVDVRAVYTQPPRPAGRGYAERPSPVQTTIQDSETPKIPVYTPTKLDVPEELDRLKDLSPDIIVVVAYGLILPESVLKIPPWGCVNVHASLLPRWRGASPIQQAILQGDPETGVTFMKMDTGLDTGPMILKKTVTITPQTTGQCLHDDLADLGAQHIVQVVQQMTTGTAVYTPQPTDGVTYAEKLSRAHGRLDWTKSAVDLDRQVRAFTPWPGSFFHWQGKVVKVLKAHVSDNSDGLEVSDSAPQAKTPTAGTVILGPDSSLHVACAKGFLQIDQLQLPGKKPMSVRDFLNGYDLGPDERFE